MRRISILATICFFACNERTQEDDCYKRNPDPGAKEGPYDLVCGHPFGYLPETPEGLGLEDKEGPYHVGLCESAESSSECSMCPTEDVNDRIREHLLEVMEDEGGRCGPAQVHHIIPECVTTPEQLSGRNCCFNAWYWGTCNIKG